ncbi:MAG: uroporphyrinogen decarboxylase family protein [Candidatus Humimicrobiaceae bacterium]
MTSKERVIKTYNFQIPDRIPIDFCADEPVYDALIKKIGLKDQLELMEYFKIDFRWARPKWIGPELKTVDGKRTDYFWIPREGVDFGYAVEHPLASVKTIKDVENYNWPKPEYYDYGVYLEEAKKFSDEGYAIYGGHWGWFFGAATDLVGMEKFMMMMFDKPDVAFKVMEKITDFFYECSKIMFEKAKGYVDIFFTGDDYGQQNGPLVSLSMWRNLIKLHIKRLYSLAKQYDLYITQHSCGSITYVLDDLIELGLNAIEPVQVRAYDMNFESLVDRYKRKVVLQGSIDTQKTLPFGNPEDVKEEVLSRIKLFKDKGGFVLGPSQHLLSEIPLENIIIMYDTAYNFGKIT